MKKIPLYKQGIEFESLAYRENGKLKGLGKNNGRDFKYTQKIGINLRFYYFFYY